MAPVLPKSLKTWPLKYRDRLRADTEVGRNLNGYFRTAMIRRVRTLADPGYPHGLRGRCARPRNESPAQRPDWTKVFEDRMALQSLLPYMSYPVRRTLHYRLLEFSWKEIGQRLALTEKQAKSRFYYGVRQAYEELLSLQARRARGTGIRIHGNERSIQESFTPPREESLEGSRSRCPHASSATLSGPVVRTQRR